mgnify:CR=1 FL=1
MEFLQNYSPPKRRPPLTNRMRFKLQLSVSMNIFCTPHLPFHPGIVPAIHLLIMVIHSSILLIEDSPGERELFRLALVQTGLDVTLFAEQDSEEAFHFLNNHSDIPSLILLDWHLGKQRGDEFLKQLRADTRLAAVPVVVFTTSDDTSDLSLAYANGANGYVVKPGTFAELIQCTTDICRYWLNRNRVPHMVGTPC